MEAHSEVVRRQHGGGRARLRQALSFAPELSFVVACPAEEPHAPQTITREKRSATMAVTRRAALLLGLVCTTRHHAWALPAEMTRGNSSRSLAFPPADLSLFVANPNYSIPPGIQLPCYGPFIPPAGARSLRHLLPRVNMGIVHHMIMFGGKGQQPPWTRPGSSHLCYQGSIMYAWARTGQTTPIGLDFADTNLEGDGFAVGPGTNFEWIALQIHYQQLGTRAVVDNSGVQLSFAREVPVRPLEIQLMASFRLRIPPRVKMDECVACRVTSGGVAVAWRNHAHRLARDIYSEHFAKDGTAYPKLGLLSSQLPQIFRVLPESRRIDTGDTVLLHCEYDATGTDRVTYLGADERTHEMCNQYLMATTDLRLNCNADRTVIDGSFSSKFDTADAALRLGSTAHAAAAPLQGTGLGEIAGLAVDEASATVYALHRAANRFDSTSPIAGPAILAFTYGGELKGVLASGIFTVPHGLSVAPDGYLWATDVKRHQVLKIDPKGAGTVVLTLGANGLPGSGRAKFNAPTDVAVHPHSGKVYVADGYGNSRIAVFAPDGTYLTEWGRGGASSGAFRVPHSIVIDRRGDVFVADRENARVQVFDANGNYKAEWVSRVSTAGARYPYSKHVSSISYHPLLDVFVVTEGDAVQLRTPSGCTLVETEGGLKWPHDAVLVPAATAAGGVAPNRSVVSHGGAQFALFVAELAGKKIKRYNAATITAGDGTVNMYG